MKVTLLLLVFTLFSTLFVNSQIETVTSAIYSPLPPCTCGDAAVSPGTPTVSVVTQNSATATWTAASHCGGITGYSIEVSLTSGGAPIAGYPITTGVTLSTGLTGLPCGTTLFVRVRGIKNVACTGAFQYTGYSGVRSFTTSACGAPTCSDGIQNQGETYIDCGGPCAPCPPGDCNNGIQDGTETGIDCGGTCGVSCSENTGSVTGTGTCTTGTAQATVYSTNCDQVGTSAYNTNSPTVQATSSSGTAPPGITCGSNGGDLLWFRLDLDADVNSVIIAFQGGTIANGTSQTYVAAYNTNSACPTAGDYVGCDEVTSFISSNYYAYNARFDGLDPTQDLWLCFYNTGKSFNLTYDVIGVSAADLPTNQSCASAVGASDNGCNLGALGAPWTPPTTAGATCGGGVWTSNDNTVYYSFTADDLTGSLLIDGIGCNDGGSGAAQFGVWTSCAGMNAGNVTPPPGGTFLGCQVGTSPLALSNMVPGQTYYIAVDGTAGDNCTWNFSGSGILLPVEMAKFEAKLARDREEVHVDWATSSESNNDYFTIQRTVDGIDYEDIGRVKGVGNSTSLNTYSFVDYMPYGGTSYYRLKQTDYDGKFKYSDIRAVNNDRSTRTIVKIFNTLGQEVDINSPGMKIILFSDNTTEKRY